MPRPSPTAVPPAGALGPGSPGVRRAGAALAVAAVLVAGAATLAAPAESSAPARPPALGGLDLDTAGLTEVSAALDGGRTTSARLVRAYLLRIDALNSRGPGLNAVRSLNPDALAQARDLDRERRTGGARGPLHGVPVLLKDNIDVAGIPTTAGSVALAGSTPDRDAFVTAQLEAAGAIVLGKTNLTELANFMTTGMPGGYSSLGGQVLNPYDLADTPSGSSAGSGSAAGAGLAAATVGTETSGSILSPARASSVVGIKPTVGLVSRSGIVPISASQDTAGPMARSVADAAALLTGMTGVDPEDPATTASRPYAGTDYADALSTDALDGARLGYVPVTTTPPSAADQVYLDALDVLRAEGAELVEVEVGGTSAPSILTYEFERDLDAYFSRLPDGPVRSLEDVIAYDEAHPREALKFGQRLLEASAEVDLSDPATAAAYEAARDQGLQETRAAIDTALRRTDADPADDLDAVVSASRTTGVGARAGYPSVIVPAGYTEDVGRDPVGLVFLGAAWEEAPLIGLASDYEEAADAWLPPTEVNPSAFRCTAVDTSSAYEGSCPP
ncbi:amidase family protein [uncultured Pseudokineococcus sp.]|uniref:amidase family protein n=1 Tax=uncultured Pseudokineococcus sp. TaxID=1642928 RepID=UPI00261B645F|nr:amidase family protein [uncultured Pseudokineococcus sp.]